MKKSRQGLIPWRLFFMELSSSGTALKIFEDPVRYRLAAARQYCLEVNEALDLELSSSAIRRDSNHDAEWKDEGRGIVFGLGLPGLARDVGGWNHRAQLRADGSSLDFRRLIVQLAWLAEQPHIGFAVPVRIGHRARQQRFSQVGANDCRTGRQLGIIVQSFSGELQRLVGDQYY